MLKRPVPLCITSHTRELAPSYLQSIGKEDLFTFLNTNLKILFKAP